MLNVHNLDNLSSWLSFIFHIFSTDIIYLSGQHSGWDGSYQKNDGNVPIC